MALRAQMENPREQLLTSMPVRERRLQLAGISTAVLEGGEGSPIILLHGPGAYAAHWLGVMPGLAKSYRVIAPDLPGHGASAVADGALDASRVLRWLGELIDQTCSAAPVLVGQLLGGAIALRFAIEHDDRLSYLVLVDTFGLAPFQPAPEFAQALMQFQTEPNPSTHDGLWRYCAFDFDRLRSRMGNRWEPFAAYNLERARTPELQAAMQALMETFGFPGIAPEELARIKAPASLIWGRHDKATPLAVAETASKRYGWPLQVIENANDDPPVEQPEALLQALRTVMPTGERVASV